MHVLTRRDCVVNAEASLLRHWAGHHVCAKRVVLDEVGVASGLLIIRLESKPRHAYMHGCGAVASPIANVFYSEFAYSDCALQAFLCFDFGAGLAAGSDVERT